LIDLKTKCLTTASVPRTGAPALCPVPWRGPSPRAPQGARSPSTTSWPTPGHVPSPTAWIFRSCCAQKSFVIYLTVSLD